MYKVSSVSLVSFIEVEPHKFVSAGHLWESCLSIKLATTPRKLRASLVVSEGSLKSQGFIPGVSDKAYLRELNMCVPAP